MAFALFFSKRLNTESQQDILRRLICLNSSLPIDNEMLAEMIYNWLTKDYSSKNDIHQGLLKGNSNVSYDGFSNNEVKQEKKDDQFANISCSIYYGNEGKRLAAVNFLNCILSSNSKQTLLFFSDEDMTWMIGNPNFLYQWSQLMKNILLKGNRIKIIHDLNRGLDEILSSIQNWIPLYMTGAIEPFYYPRKRDGIYKRSLFIARVYALLPQVP